MPVLIVNVDHIATLRQARLGIEPDPITAAHFAEISGAQGIIVHLREDRRHIQDRDVQLLRGTLKTGLHLEMAATDEMQEIALETVPDMVCLVPEKREELTTEGGLDCASQEKRLREFFYPLKEKQIRTSLFIDPDKTQIEAARSIGADYIELHTGHYADAPNPAKQHQELEKVLEGVKLGQDFGLRVNLGHGLNYHNIKAFARTPGIWEYSIGHSIISRACMVGISRAVADMATIISGFTE